MTRIFGYSIPFPSWLTLSIFFIGWVALSFLVSHLFDKYVRRWAERTKTRFDKLLVGALHGPLLVLLLLIGVRVALSGMELTEKMARFATLGVSLATSFVLIYASVKLYHEILKEYGQRYEPIKPSLGILDLLGKALIILMGLLITLDSPSISIAPLLTTLGIGGLAVALAFKDTLANFFAGLYTLADRPIHLGDYIKIEGGPEGYVEGIGWRPTRIRTLHNNIVVIPNSKASESIITNYFLPERSMSLALNINASYHSNPRRVEEILVEEATRATSEIECLLGDPAPFVRLIPGFGESGLIFNLICQVREFVDQYYVQHELRHRIFERFKKEGRNSLPPENHPFAAREILKFSWSH